MATPSTADPVVLSDFEGQLSAFSLQSQTTFKSLAELEASGYLKQPEWQYLLEHLRAINGDDYDNDFLLLTWTFCYNEHTYTLLDLCSFPGDNEDGFVFLDGEVVFTNGDMWIEPDVSQAASDSLLVQTLHHQCKVFQHLRECVRWRECDQGHAYCPTQY